MNPMMLALLQLIGNQNNSQQNPLMSLLGSNQQLDPAQQLMTALNHALAPPQSGLNPQILSLLLMNQQMQTNGVNLQQMMQMLGGQESQHPFGNIDTTKMLELLQAKTKDKTIEEQLYELLQSNENKSLTDKESEDDVVTRLQKQFQKKNEQADSEADLAEAIEFALKYDRFIEEHEDMLPDWFNANEVKEDVDKWAKTPVDRSQGLAAATVRAFFKNESMLDLLEERDRKTVKDKVLKDGLKSHEIDRKTAWPLVQRAIFNKTKLDEGGNEAKPSGKEETAIQDFGAIFEQGQKVMTQQDATPA